MSKMMKLLLASLTVAGVAAPMAAQADDKRAVACSVEINYLFNDVVRAPYKNDFVVAPGAAFSDDFSTFTRFRVFDATARLEADKSMTVLVSYYNDVGVFDAVDFSTQLTLREDRVSETNTGSHNYYLSIGAPGQRTTDFTLTCTRLKS